MTWTCSHCEHWTREDCKLGRKIYPRGGPETCRDFWREPGSDDEMPVDADMRRSQAILKPENTYAAGRTESALEGLF